MNTGAVEALLREEIGLDVESVGRGMLERALRRQLGSPSVAGAADWARRLRSDPALLRRVIEEMVVPETWFFRDGRPFDVLADEAAKRVPRERPLRVLSLPCATGEEAWSIAITLREAGLAPKDFSVTARDVSALAVAAARRGVYGKHSFRGDVGAWRERWFAPKAEGRWRVRDELRASVDFAVANLFAREALAAEGPHDFVFCRNLLIYFDPERQQEALRRLRALLAPDGLLFVGHAEASLALRAGFAPWPVARSFAFGAGSSAAATTGALWSAGSIEPWTPEPAPAPAPVFPAPSAPAPELSPEPPDHPEPPSLDLIAALADRGDLRAAAELAEARLRRLGPEAESYYLLGLARDASGDVSGGESAYRKALYLAPAHLATLAHLAALLERRGEAAEARRLRARAARKGGDAS